MSLPSVSGVSRSAKIMFDGLCHHLVKAVKRVQSITTRDQSYTAPTSPLRSLVQDRHAGSVRVAWQICHLLLAQTPRLPLLLLRPPAAGYADVAALKISEALAAQHVFDDPAECLPAYDYQSS
jgi:hypothetical protein